MSKPVSIIKIVGAVILFFLGTLFLAAGVSLLKTNIGAGIVDIVIGLGLFVYPVLKLRDYVTERKSSGKKWLALPAVAVSIPLLCSTCAGFMDADDKKENVVAPTETAVLLNDETESTLEETTSSSMAPTSTPTPTPVPTFTPTPSPAPTPTPEETTATVTKETTKETTKATTKETTKATTTEAPKKETAAPSEKPIAPTEPTPETTREVLETTSEEKDYVVNTHTGKFHKPGCSSVSKIKKENRSDRHCTREELLNAGYEPCGNCHP